MSHNLVFASKCYVLLFQGKIIFKLSLSRKGRVGGRLLSTFYCLALIVGLLESFAPFLESYKQLFHPSCSTASNGCKAQPKIFRASKRGEGLERVAYDPKWRYCRIDEQTCFLLHSTKIMYICGKFILTILMNTIFPISMQKTVRAQIGPLKKKTPI